MLYFRILIRKLHINFWVTPAPSGNLWERWWGSAGTTQPKHWPSTEIHGIFHYVLNCYLNWICFYLSWTGGVARRATDSKVWALCPISERSSKNSVSIEPGVGCVTLGLHSTSLGGAATSQREGTDEVLTGPSSSRAITAPHFLFEWVLRASAVFFISPGPDRAV